MILPQILTVSNSALYDIDLSGYPQYSGVRGFDTWFARPAGSEHYRLLHYIAHLHLHTVLLDIGTGCGLSALALAHNKYNRVISYDIVHNPHIEPIQEDNIEFRIGDILTCPELYSSPFIFLDTLHDGVLERELIGALRSAGWHGLLLLDDIHEFPALRQLWQELPLEKYDLTYKGHWSGTGLVIM